MNEVAVNAEQEHPLFAVSCMIQEQECDHKGHYRISGNLYCAIRYCIECGKSWRTWIKPEYNDVPLPEWEEIKEHMEVPPLPEKFYDDPNPFGAGDDDIDDDDYPG